MAQDIDIEYEISEQYEKNGYERAKQIYQNFLADKSYNITEEKSAKICLLMAKLALVNKDMETVRNLLNFDGGNDKSKKKSDDDSLIDWTINFLKEKSIKYDDTTFLIQMPREASEMLTHGFDMIGDEVFFVSKDTLIRRFKDKFTKSFAEPSPEHSSYETYYWFNSLLRWTNDSTTYKLHGVTQKEWMKIKPWVDAQLLTFNMHHTTILEIHDNNRNKE